MFRTFAFFESDTLPCTHTKNYSACMCCVFMDATVHVQVHAQLPYSRKFCGRKLSRIAINPRYSRRFSPSTVHTVWYYVMCMCAGDLCTLRLCKSHPNPLLLPMKHNLYMYKQFSCCCCRSENAPKL